MLLPMHLPTLLCGFLCGGPWGAAVGFLAPLMRSAILGMPPPFPTAVAMAVAESRAQRVLIAATKCGTHIAGLPDMPLAAAIADGVRVIRGLLAAQ